MSVDLSKLPQAVDALVRRGARKVILFGSAAVSRRRLRTLIWPWKALRRNASSMRMWS